MVVRETVHYYLVYFLILASLFHRNHYLHNLQRKDSSDKLVHIYCKYVRSQMQVFQLCTPRLHRQLLLCLNMVSAYFTIHFLCKISVCRFLTKDLSFVFFVKAYRYPSLYLLSQVSKNPCLTYSKILFDFC